MSHVKISQAQLLSAQRSGKIDLHDKYLTIVPEEIFGLKNIHFLDLSGNRIIEISQDIANFEDLQTLNLEENPSLVSLPHSFYYLNNLRYINLSGCTKLPESIKSAYASAKSAPVRVGENFRDARPVLEAVKMHYVEQQAEYQSQNTPAASYNHDYQAHQSESQQYQPSYEQQSYGNNNFSNTADGANYQDHTNDYAQQYQHFQQQQSSYSTYGQPQPQTSDTHGTQPAQDAPFEDPEEEAEYQRYKAAKLREMQAAAPLDEASLARAAEVAQLEAEYARLSAENEERLRNMSLLREQQEHMQQQQQTGDAGFESPFVEGTPVPAGAVAMTAPYGVGSGRNTPLRPPSAGRGRPVHVNGEAYTNVNLQHRPSPFATHESVTPRGEPARRAPTPIAPTDFSSMHAVPSAGSARNMFAGGRVDSRAAHHMNMHSDIFHADPAAAPPPARTGSVPAVLRAHSSLFTGDGPVPAATPGRRMSGAHTQQSSDIFHQHAVHAAPRASAIEAMHRGTTPVHAPRHSAAHESHYNLTRHQEHVPSTPVQYDTYQQELEQRAFLNHVPHNPATAAPSSPARTHVQTRGGAIAAVLGGDSSEDCNRVSGATQRGISGQGLRQPFQDRNASHIVVGGQGMTIDSDDHTLPHARPILGSGRSTPSIRYASQRGQQQRQGHDIFQAEAGVADTIVKAVTPAQSVNPASSRPPSQPAFPEPAPRAPLPGAQFPQHNPLYEQQPDRAPAQPPVSRPASARRGMQSSYDHQFMHAQTPVPQPDYRAANDQRRDSSHHIYAHVPAPAPSNERGAELSTADLNARVLQSTVRDLAQRNRSSNIF